MTLITNHTGKIYDLETEKALISCLITHYQSTKIYLPKIKPDFFWDDGCKRLYNAIRELTENNETVDVITLKNKTNLPASEIAGISTSIIGTSGIKSYIRILKEYADKRWFIHRVNKIDEKDNHTQAISKLSSDISIRLRDNEEEKPEVKSLLADFEEYQTLNREHIASGNKFIGFPSGYPTVDSLINGIRGQHYWVVTAYQNTGKSSYLLNIASNALNQNKRVVFFSLEMSREQNIARLLGIRTGIDPTEIEKGTLEDNLLDAEMEAKARLYEQRLTLYSKKRNIEDITVTIYAEHSKDPIDLVVIDYLQKINSYENITRYERYTRSSDTIQRICQEISVPTIVASQIDNESAKSKNNSIIATKGSGDIAGDVDLAILLRKDEDIFGQVDCIVQKNRHGMKGACKLKFFEGGILQELDTIHN